MEVLVYLYSFFSASIAALYVLYYSLSHESFADTFYGLVNGNCVYYLAVNFGAASFFALVVSLKRFIFSELRLLELDGFHKEIFKIAGLAIVLGFCSFSDNCLYFALLTLITLVLTLLVVIILKRSKYLLANANPPKSDQVKVSMGYALAIGTSWTLVVRLKACFKTYINVAQFTCNKFLCEVLLFKNVMLLIQFVLDFAKFTLSLHCISTNSDFRIRFPSFPFLKNICLILGFPVRPLIYL